MSKLDLSKYSNTELVVFAITYLLMSLVVIPVGFIFAVNTLFNVGIAYTFLNVLAAWVLTVVVRSSVNSAFK